LNPPTAHNPTAPRASDTYKTAFWNAMRTKMITNDMSVGVDTSGGFLAPDEFERSLVQALNEHNIMRQLARVIRTGSGELQIPVVTSSGSAAWLAEGAEIPLSDGTFGQVTLGAFKLATMIKVSHELLNDSAFPLESFLAQDFGRRIGDLEEAAFLNGDGVGKPTGFLATAPVGKTTDSATALTFDDVMDLYRKLKSPYRNKAVFIAHDTTVGALQKIKDGNGQYLWRPALTMGEPDTILRRPVYVSSFMPQIAAGAKALAFGDFSYYWIADRTGRTFERLNELFSQTDQVGFKAVQRCDGKLILPEAVAVLEMGS
jgi:HK97 family phage major capsid protein